MKKSIPLLLACVMTICAFSHHAHASLSPSPLSLSQEDPNIELYSNMADYFRSTESASVSVNDNDKNASQLLFEQSYGGAYRDGEFLTILLVPQKSGNSFVDLQGRFIDVLPLFSGKTSSELLPYLRFEEAKYTYKDLHDGMNQILAMAETRRSLGVRSFFINEAKNTLFVEIENLSPEKESQFRMGVLDAPFFLFENSVPETLSIPYETVAEATTPTNPDMVFSKEQLENMYAMLNGKE